MKAVTTPQDGELVIVAHVLNVSVTEGFVPAAQAMGLNVVLLTDCADAYGRYYAAGARSAEAPQIVACDVFNPLALIECIGARTHRPAGIFSNSDHLQTATALAAAYFGLPGKDWQATYRAKNKAEMRRFLRDLHPDAPWCHVVTASDDLPQLTDVLVFPCVVKPREGVASEQVALVDDMSALTTHCHAVWCQQPEQAMLIEPFLQGDLHTLETLGDGERFQVLGGFEVALSAPPAFIETEAVWRSQTTSPTIDAVLALLHEFGVGFGACHTEYVVTPTGPQIIEINYRSIGDRRDFMLCEVLGIDYFRTVLSLHLGARLKPLPSQGRAGMMRYFTAAQAGIVEQAPKAFHESDVDGAAWFVPLRTSGDQLAPSGSNRDYLGVLSVTGADARHVTALAERYSAQLTWEIGE